MKIWISKYSWKIAWSDHFGCISERQELARTEEQLPPLDRTWVYLYFTIIPTIPYHLHLLASVIYITWLFLADDRLATHHLVPKSVLFLLKYPASLTPELKFFSLLWSWLVQSTECVFLNRVPSPHHTHTYAHTNNPLFPTEQRFNPNSIKDRGSSCEIVILRALKLHSVNKSVHKYFLRTYCVQDPVLGFGDTMVNKT